MSQGVMTGVVLAGGLSSRMGEPKATIELSGRPLLSYPLRALEAVCERVAIVAKEYTELPEFDGVERWDEPDEPQHPIAGLRHALERAGGPVLVVAVDMPLVTPEVLARVRDGLAPGAVAAVAQVEGELEPLLAAYSHAALGPFATAPENEPLRRTVERLVPVAIDVPAEVVFNVNTPEDLEEAEARLT